MATTSPQAPCRLCPSRHTAACPQQTDGRTDVSGSSMKVLVRPGSRGTSAGGRGQGRGHRELARHVPLEYATREYKTKAEGLPQLLAQTEPQLESHSPGLQPEGQSHQPLQRAMDQGLAHHPHPTHSVRGPCPPSPHSPPAPPKQQPCSAKAWGAERADGLPQLHPPAHPAPSRGAESHSPGSGHSAR